jgi:hypothetical protein
MQFDAHLAPTDTGDVSALAVLPEGWLPSAGNDGTVRV